MYGWQRKMPYSLWVICYLPNFWLCPCLFGRSSDASRRQTPQEIRQAMEKQQATQQVLKMQLEELVMALKESSMVIHSELKEQNQVSPYIPKPMGQALPHIPVHFDLSIIPIVLCVMV